MAAWDLGTARRWSMMRMPCASGANGNGISDDAYLHLGKVIEAWGSVEAFLCWLQLQAQSSQLLEIQLQCSRPLSQQTGVKVGWAVWDPGTAPYLSGAKWWACHEFSDSLLQMKTKYQVYTHICIWWLRCSCCSWFGGSFCCWCISCSCSCKCWLALGVTGWRQ